MTSGGDFFALFGLERNFRLDGEELSRRYRALQSAAHPDKFAGKSEAEKMAAQTAASRINDGYRTLKDPLLRAAYMLSLEGTDALAESDAQQMSAEFLMQQMEWRDALEESKAGGGGVDSLRAEVADAERAVAEEAANLLAGGAALPDEQKQQLADIIRRWHYIRKMLAAL